MSGNENEEHEDTETFNLKIIDEKKNEKEDDEPEIRNRFRNSSEESGAGGADKSAWSSIYDEDKKSEKEAGKQRRVEKDPETTQSFIRTEQAGGMFSVIWGGGQAPKLISREEAWKIYIKKLQEESNYLLASPDKEEICCCQECIMEYELQCNEVLGWRKRAPTVEGFSREVNKLCDPSATDIMANIIQEKYSGLRSLPCAIM